RSGTALAANAANTAPSPGTVRAAILAWFINAQVGAYFLNSSRRRGGMSAGAQVRGDLVGAAVDAARGGPFGGPDPGGELDGAVVLGGVGRGALDQHLTAADLGVVPGHGADEADHRPGRIVTGDLDPDLDGRIVDDGVAELLGLDV